MIPQSGTAARRAAERYLMNTYKRPPLVFTRGKGCYLWDDRGKKYLDFLGGIAVNALGHAHPRIVRVVRREAARAIHLSNLFHNQYQGPLAEKLVKWSGLDHVFFTNSGSEAIEGALKLSRIYARKKTGADSPPVKTKILALEHSFHGRTFGALAITASAKYRVPYEPLMPGAVFVRFNDVADLEAKFDDSVCAVILEPVQGEGGVFPVSEAFYNRARQLCTDHDAALIADEIQCGLGRTGRYFAYQKFSALPDIAVVAKPLAGGLPLGAILASEKFASAFSPGLHGTTFGGGPMICAAALEFLNTLEKEKLLANVRARGEQLRAGLEKLKSKFDFVKEVRGEGLIAGMELTIEGAAITQEALRRGVIINCTHERTLRFLPPFIVTSKQVNDFLAALERVLAGAARKNKAAAATPVATAAGSAR
ncbi:MAG: aspartate aminotransferase family protein [Acidobacteria bacterium]|nr:aspartate aminotransferase family protein [Acidobacteriota bacterium]MCL5286584.1 aspartate aminotransferase family protein [Acidobacteriota bacterium]